MKIGILQTGHAPAEIRPRTGDYADLFIRLLDGHDFDFVVYDIEAMEFPDTASVCDGWLITGSRHGAYEDHAFIPPLEDLIRDIYAAGLPLVGVCFGHQVIAQALGGKVEKYAGGWAVGRQVYQMNGQDCALNAWHQDQVVAVPAAATVVGSNDFCANAALVYDDRIFSVQAHPEFDVPVMQGLITHRGPGVVPDAQLQAARDSLDTPLDTPRVATQIARFFKERTLV